jgi:hypothetical protein
VSVIGGPLAASGETWRAPPVAQPSD